MVSPPLRVKLSGFCVCLVKRERYTTLKYRRSWWVPDAPILGFGKNAQNKLYSDFGVFWAFAGVLVAREGHNACNSLHWRAFLVIREGTGRLARGDVQVWLHRRSRSTLLEASREQAFGAL